MSSLEKLKNKSATVVVVDPGSATRLMMTSVLRASGFENVAGFSSLDDAMSTLSGKDSVPDWLITSLFPDSKVNALHILQLSRTNEHLKNVRISLFVAAPEEFVLPRAFALGALSWHKKPFTQTEFKAAIAEITSRFETYRWNEARVAASYLREVLKKQDDARGLVALARSLVQAFPLDASFLLDFAETLFAVGSRGQARSLLWQAAERDESLRAEAEGLAERLLGSKEALDAETKPGLCIVVDSDGAAVNIAKDALESAGAAEIQCFTDGQACWEWIVKARSAKKTPDIIIMEWRIPKLSGPQLLQRIRAAGMRMPTIVVNSSLVGKKHQPLLEEMGVATILEKPTKKAGFLNCIAWAVSEARSPTEDKTLEQRIRALLASGKQQEAKLLMARYLKMTEATDPKRRLLEGEVAFSLGEFETARDLAKESLALGNKSVLTYSVLGKALMKLRDFNTALQIFEKANEISPDSVERLCAMAEAQVEVGLDEKARATVQQAAKIDDKAEAVTVASVNVGLATGDSELAGQAIARTKATANVLAFVNNRGVALAKAQKFSESTVLYKNALAAIPSERQDLRAIVLYNLALSLIQENKLSEANEALSSLKAVADVQLQAKAKSLHRRLGEAVASGQAMVLNRGSKSDDALIMPEAIGRVRTFKTATKWVQGSLPDSENRACCYGIFKDQSDNVLLESLLDDPPKIGGR